MVVEVVASLIASAVIACGALAWRLRGELGLVRTLIWPFGTVRVSFCALLRFRDDGCYVLFHTPSRPGTFGPPGGVFKYRASALTRLDRLGFREEARPEALSEDMRHDLRGFVPARSAPGFALWFAKSGGIGRESATECLRRELTEELGEVGHPELIPDVAELDFIHVRTIRLSPHRELGSAHLHMRRFEIYDIDPRSEAAVRLRNQLLELARDPSSPNIAGAGVRDIEYGRCAEGLIGGHSGFLTGTKHRFVSHPAIR
jgi:hypothetical protein